MKKRKNVQRDANIRVPSGLTNFIRQSVQRFTGRKAEVLKHYIFSKFVSKETAPPGVRRARAIAKWLACERNNEATNVRLLTTQGDYQILPRIGYERFMEKTAEFVRDIIGEVPSMNPLNGGFSGGASTSRLRTESHPALKYVGKADVTRACYDMALEEILSSELWTDALDDLNIVPGNVLFTVPKDVDIDRCACKEPDMNMYIQRGFGNQIRRSLKRVGVNLNDQSRNQSLARIGSTDGSLATIDLSSASDSVCYELVAQLLPPVWFAVLASARSEVTEIDGEIHKNEMFSSMGNGFTFELESLLFYCIARSVAYFEGVPGVISVYGDDIIVPTETARGLITALNYLGFSVNTDKSFVDGTFRESCGGFYDTGCDVTPFFIKRDVVLLTDLIQVCNKLRRWADIDQDVLDPEVEDLWKTLAAYVPRCFWGGHELQSIERLVSYEVPEFPRQLSARSKRVDTLLGGLLLRLDVEPSGVTLRGETTEAMLWMLKGVPAKLFGQHLLKGMIRESESLSTRVITSSAYRIIPVAVRSDVKRPKPFCHEVADG